MNNEVAIAPKNTWKERQKKQLKKDLINSALKLFEEKGFDQPSVDEIVEVTGVAKGTFYLYFKSKADIQKAVLVYGIEELEKNVAEAMAEAPDEAPAALRTIVSAVLAFFEQHHFMISLLLRSKSFIQTKLPAVAADDIRSRYRKVTTSVYERFIRKGMLQGYYREVDAALAAHALYGMLVGLVYEAIDENKSFTSICDNILDFFENGVKRHA